MYAFFLLTGYQLFKKQRGHAVKAQNSKSVGSRLSSTTPKFNYEFHRLIPENQILHKLILIVYLLNISFITNKREW